MNKELESQYTHFKTLIEEYYLPVFNAKIDHHIQFIEKTGELQSDILKYEYDFSNVRPALLHHISYKEDLLKLATALFTFEPEVHFDVDYRAYNQALNVYLETVPKEVSRPQDSERFRMQSGDSYLLGFAKWWKRTGYTFSVLPVKMANGFRTLFKETKKELPLWKHSIEFRNISAYYFREILPSRLSVLEEIMYGAFTSSSHLLLKVDEEIDLSFSRFLTTGDIGFPHPGNHEKKIGDEIRRLQALKTDLKNKAEDIYNGVFEEFQDKYLKAGTIEVNNRRFGQTRQRKKHRVLVNKYTRLVRGWQNTLLVLSDDWGIDLELYALIYTGLKDYHSHMITFDERLALVVEQKLSHIKSFLNHCKEDIERSDEKTNKDILEKELLSVKRELVTSYVPDTNQLMLAQDLPSLINDLESRIDKGIRAISERRAVVRKMNYEQPISSGSISYISPYELVNFESWPQFLKVFKSTKVAITDQLNQLQNRVMDIGHIAEFNLESAVSLYEVNEAGDDPRSIALEGIKRTIEKVEGIEEALARLSVNVKENLSGGFDKFRDSLVRFTNSDNIYEVRVRIARGKAVERSRQYKAEFINRFRNTLPAIVLFAKTKYARFSGVVNKIFRRYGISGQQAVPTELADFLAETEKSIEKLPFVYQRLFKTEPLSDANFFEGRTEELVHLNNAYNNWMKGRFATAAVVGEKGSGITTLMNFYLQDLSTASKVYRFAPGRHYHTSDELLSFLSEELGCACTTQEELVTFLNHEKKVIVLENIQRLYLKKVNGFGALKLFTELLSLTSRKVFWIVSCTSYSWEYLNKTINLSDHFSYTVLLKEFDDDTIINIINKRHRVSGYNIEFEPAASDLNNKKFKRLGKEEQQTMLERSYFSDLNKIARSNVSLALIYWLRSTNEIHENTIFIGSLKEIDFSFMKNLPAEKVFVLANLLLHERLSEQDFCNVTGYSRSKTRSLLQPLLEDGVTVLQNEQYTINPLLYRQTINMLRMKNIIH
ncbi:hypothetical protein C900_04897 [Fulvivirga imtechensis AK7]|uniref:ATP-binding protein n=1 Tax=Fulvivirga imtechensis AK7 TaxID=1237149 RepID=L8JQM1_9BACT|nr:ATP-binding protein [Fulvivirga imtechensis]ELR69672.1 hypothetical protein C900_04897 [Fulvivirga imtechensis AK7]